jgi:hypothetical protein
MVYTAGVVLAGVCVLGLYLGIQPSLERAADLDQPPAASASTTPGMAAAAVQAVPLKTDTPPPSAAPASSAPAQLAQASKKKDVDEDETPPSDAAPATAQAGRKPATPEPPTLYSPDEPPAPAPAGETNTPPY